VILITLFAWAEECLASGMGGIWSSPLTVVSSHSSLAFVKQDIGNSFTSIAAIAARRFDAGEGVEIEIGDRLQRLGGGCVAKSIRQRFAPGGICGLQGEQFGDRVAPALWPCAPVDWPSVANDRCRFATGVADAIEGLALGVAERVFSLGLTASWHGMTFVT
jgi:hypothetical protein